MMKQPTRPPGMEFFSAPRPRRGGAALGLRLGEIGLALNGLDSDLAAKLARRFDCYVESPVPASSLHVQVVGDPLEHFIEPPAGTAANRVLLACEGKRVRYLGHRAAGWFDTCGGRGLLVLSSGAYEPAERAVENYVRAAVAWQAAERGGALVHGASAVLDGRGYLFFGPSGAGKSTLAECNRRARVVSDDLSLVLPGPGSALELVGSPFRGTYEEGEPVVGRFPLMAAFRIVKDVRSSVRPAPRLLLLSELVGSLPFVAEGFSRRPDLFGSLEAGFASVPLARLHFRRDDDYWDAILHGAGGASS